MKQHPDISKMTIKGVEKGSLKWQLESWKMLLPYAESKAETDYILSRIRELSKEVEDDVVL